MNDAIVDSCLTGIRTIDRNVKGKGTQSLQCDAVMVGLYSIFPWVGIANTTLGDSSLDAPVLLEKI